MPFERDDMNPADSSARRKRKIVLIAALGVFVLVLLLIASLTETTQQQQISVPVDRSTETPLPVQVPNFPPLQIQSSGHLPQQVQGVHLGMTIAEAIQVEPDLSTFYPSKKADPTAAEALLVAKTARGFSNTLEFKGGRLHYMEFELANMSPEDTSLLRSDILAQLGPPSGQMWDFPEITQLVWIDGDVRIAYEDWAFFSLAGESNGRHPRLIVADWPAYKQSLLSSSMDESSKYHELAKWGEEAVQFRPLPHELDGLQLRMLPWQMRAALGSEGLERSPCGTNCEGWKKTLPGGGSLNIMLWHNQVTQITEQFNAIKPSEIRSAEDQLVELYGTPVDVAPLAATDFKWTDGQVEVDCAVSAGTKEEKDSPASPPWTSCTLTDLQLYRARNEEMISQREPKYESVASPKSFF